MKQGVLAVRLMRQNGCLQWVNQFRYALTYHTFIIQFKLQYCHNFLFNSIRCYLKKKDQGTRQRDKG